jgi:hypothetical protein
VKAAWLTLAYLSAAAAQRAELPEFIHGDECLFCHRAGVGATWQKTRHGVTLRERADAPDLVAKYKPRDEVTHLLGSRDHVRFLKKSGYNQFEILEKDGHWDKKKFGDRCAGCHTTAVDSNTQTFTYFGLDCYACHGVVDLNHSTDTSKVWLSKKRRRDVKEITTTCAQCHLREVAKARSTGLPYPANFVVGDDLFKDYDVDYGKLASLNPADRHVLRNVMDVVKNDSELSCLSCHNVHASSTQKHRMVLTSAACLDCHFAEGPKSAVRKFIVHSAMCEY